ncbi:MAG: M20/M25/M40 family metallo-hydrolase [Hyphomicrobiales bacterium]
MASRPVDGGAARGHRGLPGVSFEVLRAYEPTFTMRHDPVVQSFSRATTQVLGVEPVPNMRVGASDARLCRRAGIPTVICGLTPNNMGAHDEYEQVEELMALGEIFTRCALGYLTSER